MEAARDHTPMRAPEAQHAGEPLPSRPDLLVIGGMGRNSGKTELACRLIARAGATMPVAGLKVTTVERTDGHCPHGGAGCGVCSSLDRPWIVSRELDRRSPKDTCRMLASGARRVYWLRALRSELRGGVAELLSHVPSGWLVVCESTSLRQLVEPGLFLLVRGADSDGAKASARSVAHLADRVVASDRRSFDLELGRISVVDGRWVLRREGCAMVIGGEDRRSEALHRTCASLEAQFDRVLAGPGDRGPGRVSVPPVDLSGPPEEWCLVTSPLADGVPPGLVNALFRRTPEADVVVATTCPEGPGAPLALCRRALLPEVVTAREQGLGAVRALGDRCTVAELRWSATRPVARPQPMSAAAQRAVAEAG